LGAEMMSLKVMTVLGTRPEIIRLSRTLAELDKHVDHIIVHTGQNYDYQLNKVFFKELGVREPDHFMAANRDSLGKTIADIISKAEEIFSTEKPDALLILGDTNSSLAAYMAKRMKIPIFHMEAGNRCFDWNVPEETNRRIIDHISDINLVYTEHARRNLLNEGIPSRRIYLTGSPMNEVLKHYRHAIDESEILERLELQRRRYIVASVHREENVDVPAHFASVINALNHVAESAKMAVVVSTHPRTKKRLGNRKDVHIHEKLRFSDPFGFSDYVKLQMESYCCISDSGTISEESAILGFPAVTIRNAMERPEAMDAGNVIISGLDASSVWRCVQLAVSQQAENNSIQIPQEYTVTDTSNRVVKLIVGLSPLVHDWQHIKK